MNNFFGLAWVIILTLNWVEIIFFKSLEFCETDVFPHSIYCCVDFLNFVLSLKKCFQIKDFIKLYSFWCLSLMLNIILFYCCSMGEDFYDDTTGMVRNICGREGRVDACLHTNTLGNGGNAIIWPVEIWSSIRERARKVNGTFPKQIPRAEPVFNFRTSLSAQRERRLVKTFMSQ